MHSLRVREHPIEGPYVQGIKSLFSLKNQKINLFSYRYVIDNLCNFINLKKNPGITLDLFKLCQICPNMLSMTSLILKSWWTEEILSGTFFTKVWYQDFFLGGGNILQHFLLISYWTCIKYFYIICTLVYWFIRTEPLPPPTWTMSVVGRMPYLPLFLPR